tara:strand:+ start:195 stop:899 length:705 start_codon:yes stop_codon:yes gene_type:complete
MKYVVFHNAADDSYMNTVENFAGAYSTTQTIDIYFKSATDKLGYDKIICAVTNGEEDRAVEELAAAMTKNSSVITIADDVNTVYACQNITSVTSITLGSIGQVKPVIEGKWDGSNSDIGGTAHSMVFTNKHSGAVVNVPATTATSTMTLPSSPVTGFNLRFVASADSSAHTNTIAGAFHGITDQNGSLVEHTGTTSMVIAASDFHKGDWFEIVYTGAAYVVSGTFDTGSAMAIS